ncbi:DNA mismatch repair protein MLH3 [Camellia lanceoleosa]|uniref:DNA mismatch repair protein MLH3 n=1 Tax=Camellia lanceoleosa TaxID=1840588 RepID=A0ACC0H2S0_9ERIC|nr:DNA mismatch repair protein MLH3 [Camellia lanceoleosa]
MNIEIKAWQVMELEESSKYLLRENQQLAESTSGLQSQIQNLEKSIASAHISTMQPMVLSGEMKTVTYLDTKQKLVLPEIGYQLLHNYADQIQNWGWLCNIRSLGSRSFKKNLNLLHRQSTVVTLNAVPCIVGVNLTDVDLLEFLQQLALLIQMDHQPYRHPFIGSLTPKHVEGESFFVGDYVLNFAYWFYYLGAVMFGDTLLPSECSLIVEELKQTSLCFQCAHGRPTTVPLVNLEALHKQIAKLGLWNGGSNELWHGLHQHEPSLERAAQRLSSARGTIDQELSKKVDCGAS